MGAQVCSNITLSAHRAIQYLRGERASLEPACVRKALEKLAAPRYASHAALVTRYLDYRAPGPPSRDVIIVQRIPATSDQYPAVGTLFLMGLGAAPAVEAVLRDADASALARRNGIEAFALIHRAHPEQAVRKLRQASLAEKDPVAARLLSECAHKAAAWCGAGSEQACSEALR